MSIPTIQTAFNAGEMAPSLWGNVSFNKMAIGASTMRNYFVGYRGGALSRAGTAFVGYSKQTQFGFAVGTIFFPANPSINDTITLNGVVFTFIAGASSGTNIHIGATCGITIGNNLTSVLLASVNPAISVASYAGTGGPATATLTITYKTSSAAGNNYTIAASAAIVSGGFLTGGGAYPPRLVTFQFNLDQGLVLEFGQQYMRVISDGAFVVEAPITITGATQNNPCVVHLMSTVGLSTGDWGFIAGIVGMTQLNGRTFVITVINGTDISLADVFGNPINSSFYGAYISGGTFARIYTLVTPYNAVDLPFLKFTQSADVMSLVLRNQTTGTEYVPYDLARLADDNWTLTALATGSSIGPPTDTAAAETTSQVGTLAGYAYVTTAVSAADGQESVASNIGTCTNIDISAQAGANQVTWDPSAGSGYSNIYRAPIAYAAVVPDGSLFGFIGSSFGSSFIDSNIIPDLSQVPPLHLNPFSRGQIIAAPVTSPGSGMTGVSYVIHTSTGSGAVLLPITSGDPGSETLVAVVVENPGEGYEPGDTVTYSDAAAVAATGNIFFPSNPSPGDTATFNGVVFTFVASGGTGTNITIGGTTGLTIGVLEARLQASVNPLLTVASYQETGGPATATMNVTYNTTGSAGNSYTLAASAATPSAGTLTGGTGGVSPTGTLTIGAESGTYPSAVAYFQERRVYANTANQPDTYWMSQPGAFKNFDARIPTIDSDAIVGTPWSVQVDGIQFMLPILGGLVVLTGQAAYQVVGTGGSPSSPQPVTPSSQQALPQAYNGCHFQVPPVKIDYDIYYLQAKGSVIRSLSYNFWINVFTGVDVTYLSSQLFTGFNIDAMAWCEEPYKVLWCIRDDGVLLSLTSLKTQDVMGWARSDTQGLFVDATSVVEPPIDALYLATQRFLSGGKTPYMIERMDDRIWASIEECWCVDAGLELAQLTAQCTLTITGNPNGSGVPTSATGLVGGSGYSDETVVTLNDPTGTGCVVTATIVGGAITALGFAGGTLYTDPLLQFVDPQGNGSGASATVVLTNTVTVTADSPIFSMGSIGQVIRGGGGILQLTAFSTATVMTAAVVSPITVLIPGTLTVLPFQFGKWTIGTPTTTITGLDHLEGLIVTGLADGNVIPPTIVVGGSITLANAASAVIVGLPFTPQLQSLYLERGQPTVQGRRTKIGAVTIRVSASGSFLAGANQIDGSAQSPMQIAPVWTNLQTISTSTPDLARPAFGAAQIANTTVIRPVPLFTGDIRVELNSTFAKPGQAAVEQNVPLPLDVLAFIRESEAGDSPEVTPKPRQRGDGPPE